MQSNPTCRYNADMYSIDLNYRENTIRVQVCLPRTARLFINNIQRDEQTAGDTQSRLNLTSSVQTDYEWHEFIEADVQFQKDNVRLTLLANKTVIADETVPLENLE